MFHKARLWERFKTKFRDDKLSKMLSDIIGEDTPFGSDKLHTLLMIVLRNATTDSPWPLTNNPTAKYNLAAATTAIRSYRSGNLSARALRRRLIFRRRLSTLTATSSSWMAA